MLKFILLPVYTQRGAAMKLFVLEAENQNQWAIVQ